MIARLDPMWSRAPRGKNFRPAIKSDSPAIAYIPQGLANLIGTGLALPKPDITSRSSEIPKIFGKVLAVAAGSKKQAGEADRVDHDIGPRLLGEVLVIGIAYCDGDPHVGRQLASR